MQEQIENIEKVINHWKDSSDKDYITMHNLLKSKDYNWALFIGHLVLEKLIKACFVKNKKTHPVFTHDLLRLATLAGIEISNEKKEYLDEITTFNINARYDNYKQDFYNLCTEDFSNIWSQRIEILREWLIKQL